LKTNTLVSCKNPTSFSGIKLSKADFEHVRNVAFYLQRTGFTNLGHKTLFVSNEFQAKHKALQNMRTYTGFDNLEFGAVFLPWSHEAFIVALPEYEQFMLPVVKQIDKKAVINLMI